MNTPGNPQDSTQSYTQPGYIPPAGQPGRHAEVVEDREPGKDAAALRHVRQAAATDSISRPAGDVGSVERDPPGAGADQAGERTREATVQRSERSRRLARTEPRDAGLAPAVDFVEREAECRELDRGGACAQLRHDLGRLLALCLKGDARSEAFELKKSAVVCLQFEGQLRARQGVLSWSLTPRILRQI